MKIFGREPALIISATGAVLGVVVSFNVGLSAVEAGWWMALLSAGFGAAAAAATRPIAPAAFTGLVAAGAGLLTAYGFDVSAETVGSINAAVLAGLALLTRGQVSPVAKPKSVGTI